MSKILIVDDNPHIIDMIQQALSKGDNDVKGFCDPFLALGYAIDNPPDLVIVDQMMPFIEGSQLIKEMKKAGIKSKFIIMSGFSQTFMRQDLDGLGVVKYLSKPLPNAILAEEINAVLH